MATKIYTRASNGHEYQVTTDENGKVVKMVNETTGKTIPLSTRTARKFPKGFA